MEKQFSDVLDKVLKAATIFLTLSLVWFSLVYYPKVVNQYKSYQTRSGGLVGNIEASSKSLPYENGHFKIQYLGKSNVYVVTILAQTADQYTQYKEEAGLTLKNILSLDKLCGLNIVYSSSLPFGGSEKSSKGHC